MLLDSFSNLRIMNSSDRPPRPAKACPQVMLPSAGSCMFASFGPRIATTSANPMNTARMDQIAPGASQPLAVKLSLNSRNSTVTLYQGRKDAMNISTPPPAANFSPMLSVLSLSNVVSPFQGVTLDALCKEIPRQDCDYNDCTGRNG